MLRDALRIHRDLGDRFHTAATLCEIARILAVAHGERTAARLLARADVLQEEVGIRPPWLERVKEETLAIIRTDLDDASFAEAWEQGRALDLDEAVELALEPEPDA